MVESALTEEPSILKAVLLIDFDDNTRLVVVDDFGLEVVGARWPLVQLLVTEVFREDVVLDAGDRLMRVHNTVAHVRGLHAFCADDLVVWLRLKLRVNRHLSVETAEDRNVLNLGFRSVGFVLLPWRLLLLWGEGSAWRVHLS